MVSLLCFGVTASSALIGIAGESFLGPIDLSKRFAFIFVMVLLLGICIQPIMPLIDAETLRWLNRHSKRERYGPIRFYGTFAWSVATISMGAFLYFGDNLSLIFYGTALAFAGLGIIARTGLKNAVSQPIKIPFKHLKNDTPFQWFLFFCFLMGIVSNAAFSYTSFFFDDIMKTPLEIGVIFGTWTLLEIPVMIFSKRLIDALGNRILISAGLAINGLRLYLFSLFTLDTPFGFKLGAALLQGLGFGFTLIGMIDFVDRQAHRDLRATYMSVTSVAKTTIASAIGGALGSLIVKQWGTAILMRSCGFAFLALMGFFLIFVKKQASKTD